MLEVGSSTTLDALGRFPPEPSPPCCTFHHHPGFSCGCPELAVAAVIVGSDAQPLLCSSGLVARGQDWGLIYYAEKRTGSALSPTKCIMYQDQLGARKP